MGLDINRILTRNTFSKNKSWASLWQQRGAHKKPKKVPRTWKSMPQKYQFHTVVPEAERADFSYDFDNTPKQHFHPFSLPGYSTDFNIELNRDGGWNPGTTQEKISQAEGWNNYVYKIPKPIFGTDPASEGQNASQQSAPESTWFSDVINKIV